PGGPRGIPSLSEPHGADAPGAVARNRVAPKDFRGVRSAGRHRRGPAGNVGRPTGGRYRSVTFSRAIADSGSGRDREGHESERPYTLTVGPATSVCWPSTACALASGPWRSAF